MCRSCERRSVRACQEILDRTLFSPGEDSDRHVAVTSPCGGAERHEDREAPSRRGEHELKNA